MNDAAGYQGIFLINALNLHKNTVHSLWKLSKQQNRLLKSRRYTKLFASKHDKETLIQSLKKWAAEIRYYYDNWNTLENALREEDRAHVLSLIDKISDLIENTLIIENENRTLLEKRRRELIRDLGTVDFYQECLFNVLENRN